MSGYVHLSPAERDRIADLKSAGASLRAIAEALGRSPSTISRELRRNACPRGAYRPHVADGAYLLRRQRAAVLERDTALAGYVTDRLAEVWTPEQIAGRLTAPMRGSITFDNDTAFARHTLLRSMLTATTYFCDAYASWQKGGVESANGRLRRWLPRRTDLDSMDDQDIQEIAMTLNLTPRKCLGFRSPLEAFLGELGKQVDIRFHGRVALRA